MNNKIIGLLMFATGAGVGSVATWQFLKKKYERTVDEEIRSFKEQYRKKHEEPTVDTNEDARTTYEPTEEEKEEYAEIIEAGNYMTYSVDEEPPKLPYVIAPDEFGDDEDYEQTTYSYCADGILIDEDYRLVEDVEGTVGFDSLTRFGEYEPDAVHVKNDRLKMYFEILIDEREYSEILEKMPYLAED